MDVSVIDIGGNFIGPALGFELLGHKVSYFSDRHGGPFDFLRSRFSANLEQPLLHANLVIYAASFSDEAWALELDLQLDAPIKADEPFFSTINPGQARIRQKFLLPRLACVPNLVMVDMGDSGDVLDPDFLQFGMAHFKRELPVYGHGAKVQPFPFLYAPGLLDIEWRVELSDLHLPPQKRQQRAGALFAGTIGHWRYFGRRRLLLSRFTTAHPEVQVQLIEGGYSQGRTWELLQEFEYGLYLPGRGDLCFRMHEAGALGVPMLRLQDFDIEVPKSYRQHFPMDPGLLKRPQEMLAFYMSTYHPVHAARWILERSGTSGLERPTAFRHDVLPASIST